MTTNMFPVDVFGHPINALIPVDDMKRSLVQWKEYQTRLPTIEEKRTWIEELGDKIKGWAMPTGQVTSLVALDFDGEEGLETLKKLGLRQNVRTPGNGAHVWIKTKDYPVRTGVVDSRWPSMELKGDGGYVIVLGKGIKSYHNKNSLPTIGDYYIIDGLPSLEGDLGYELAQFVFQPKEQNPDYAVARVVSEALEMVKNGRNNAGFWLACQLRDLGETKEKAWDILEGNFYPEIPRGNHAYSKSELKNSLASAYTRPAKKTGSASVIALELFNKETDTELWHTSEHESYLSVGDENMPVGSVRTREYISMLYFRAVKKPIGNSALEEVINTLKWTALIDGKEHETHLRVGYLDGQIHLDNEGLREIKFLHTKTMGMLPQIKRGKSVELLRKYINIDDRDWPLIQGLVLSHFMPSGSYPIGVFVGPQGSAKSTNQSIILSILDPRPNMEAGRSRLPRNDNDLVVIAKQNLVIGFDNITTISDWLSDAICIFSTGGALMKRRLYTDDDVVIYAQKKPVLLNGIGDIVTKADLLDRSIVIECPTISEYRTERKLLSEFNEDLPYILGAFKDLAQHAMNRLDKVDASSSIRMVDFVRWCLAAEIDKFIPTYLENRNRGAEIAVNNSAVGRYLLQIAVKHRGQPTNKVDLAERLNVPEQFRFGYYISSMNGLYEEGELLATGDYDWPRKFESFVSQLQRIEPMINRLGIKIHKHHTEFQDLIFVGYEA